MGWCMGTEISIMLYKKIRRYIQEDKRKKVANIILDVFEDYDADCYNGDSIIEKDAGRKYEE